MSRARVFLILGTPLFAALVLAYLLLPGTLVTDGTVANHDTEALQKRLERLREYAHSDVCEVAEVGPPTIVQAEEETDETVRAFRPVPVDPDETPVPPEATAPGEEGQSLADLIRSSVVLVIALGEEASSIGTGFVVDDRHIVTNFHVIEDASRVIATSRTSAEPFAL